MIYSIYPFKKGGHLIPETLASVKVVIVIGVIEETHIKTGLDPRIDQIDVTFSA